MTPQQLVADFYRALDDGQAAAFLTSHAQTDFLWRAGQPFGDGRGVVDWLAGVSAPLQQAMPDRRRETHMLFGGASNANPSGDNDGNYWVTATGYLHGRFQADFLGLSANKEQLRLRWSDFFKIEEGKIAAILSLIDIVDFLQQIGCDPLPASNGEKFIYPAPHGLDGVRMQAATGDETDKTMWLVRGLLYDGLNNFDESDLASMGMERFFHKNLRWYGPGGIGACLSLAEFQSRHQGPWLKAFPDRKAVHLDNLICDGPFCGSAWWEGVEATQAGNYLGIAASDKKLMIGGIDYWLRDGDTFTENWVFIDFVDLFRQVDFDLLAAARAKQDAASK